MDGRCFYQLHRTAARCCGERGKIRHISADSVPFRAIVQIVLHYRPVGLYRAGARHSAEAIKYMDH
jgi:hypothetical protein